MASGACIPCSLPMGRKDVGGPSPPQHRTALVPPHRGLERLGAAPDMPGARGTLTYASAKLHGCISRYLSAISFASQISKAAAFCGVSEALHQCQMKVESREP